MNIILLLLCSCVCLYTHLDMDLLNEIKQMGVSLGYEGQELRNFIKDQQAQQRADRAELRQKEKEECEYIRQKEKEEREYKLKLETAELEKQKADTLLEAEREKSDREIKLKHIENTHEMELVEMKAKTGVSTSEVETIKAKGPKLPAFEEGKDEMDSYLHRFERYAIAQNWKPEVWVTHLSALLKGRALDVYALLPSEKALDYNELKKSLLKRYELTEDGFKRKFRACRPEPGETFSQFSVRLASYLTKWIEMSDCLKTYEALFDLMMRDQFLHICNKELTLYLKERIPPSLQQMATLADQFKEARLTSAVSLTYPSGTKRSNSKPRQGSVNQFDTGKKQESSGFRKGERRCLGVEALHIWS